MTEYSEFLESTPAHWNRFKMQEVGRIVSGGTPSRDVPSLWDGGIPWVTPGELTSLPTKEIHETAETISAAGLSGSGANLLPAQSLLITSRATLGARAVNSVPMATNQGFKSLVPFNEQMTDFLYHLVDKIKPEMVRRASGTTFLEISGSEFGDIDLSLPPTEEAVKIAEILDTLDAAIRGTEAVLAKLKAMKQGLLHDLLTRGIDANGDLRPTQPEAPHLYKQTPLGWLPKEWDCGRLEDYCSRICVGIVIKPADYYVEEGVPTFRSANVREGYIAESDFVFISPASNAMLHKSQIRKGDILTVRTGYPGTSAVVPEEYDGCNCVDILISTPLGSISSEFLCSWINSPFGKGQVLSGQGGLAQQHFNVGEMRELIVVKPSSAEQEMITSRIDTAEAKIQTEQKLLNKLRLQKSGLMDDLLTGRTPVTSLL
ncbi:hypothetical protein P279_07575 [Rhodobacteraceae bacterium PD-2]|nr:hypothetical protein P279_07575 [Rhodobacteraceae bacterium PD-2]